MSSFKISCWNIQGLYSSAFGLKSKTSHFVNSVNQNDIIILSETWCRVDVPTNCPPNYKEVVVPSQKIRNISRGRDSGGIILWYKSTLHNSLQILKIERNYIWLKLKRDLIPTERDIYLCAIYIPPSESPYYPEDIFSCLESEICYYQAQGNILLCGDFNARTGTHSDVTSILYKETVLSHSKIPLVTNSYICLPEIISTL